MNYHLVVKTLNLFISIRLNQNILFKGALEFH